MNNFKHGKREIEFWTTSGEVMSSEKRSETHVSSSGGGGHVGREGGYVAPPTIQSEAITKHEFWMKTDEGKEMPVQLEGLDIPLLPGQKVTMLSAKKKGNDSGYYAALINHSAGQYWPVSKAETLLSNFKMQHQHALMFLLFTPAMAWLGSTVTREIILGGGLFAGGYAIFHIIVNFMLNVGLDNKLDSHIDGLAKELLSQ